MNAGAGVTVGARGAVSAWSARLGRTSERAGRRVVGQDFDGLKLWFGTVRPDGSVRYYSMLLFEDAWI